MPPIFLRSRATAAAIVALLVLIVAACAAGSGGVGGPSKDGGAGDTGRGAARTSASVRPSASPDGPPAPAAPTQAPPLAPAARPSAADRELGPRGATERASVLRVVDGDTIEVDRGRGAERVRYIGVDTPETVKPGTPVEWMGREASAANRALVEGQDVVLERDVSETDRYGRLLRYVWLQSPDGWLFVNLELLRRGLAQVATYPPDVAYVDLYLEAQREARDAGRGLWGEPPSGDGSAVDPGPTPQPAGTPAAAGDDCDPSYPGVCIPLAPPDLDCGDIPFRRFDVLPPDPHRFDSDGDGVGCESD